MSREGWLSTVLRGDIALAPGVKVVITQGLAAGKIGVIHEKWPVPFFRGGPAMWRVRSDDFVRDRILRADWLRAIP